VGQALFMEDPRATLEVFATGWGRWRRGNVVRWKWGAPLQQWSEFLAAASSSAPDLPEPDAAGVLTILSYELKHWIERLPRRHVVPVEPVLFSAFYDWSGVVDYRTWRAWVRTQTSSDLHVRVRGWCGGDGAGTRKAQSEPAALQVRPTMSESAYYEMVETALEYIAAGDIYQVNLAQRFRAPLKTEHGVALFEALRASYPMPFGAYVDGGDWVVVSNSPECFLLADGSSVATFPIKGTRRTTRPRAPADSTSADGASRTSFATEQPEPQNTPLNPPLLKGDYLSPPLPRGEERGVASGEERDRAARELENDPKERAEHVMIVDLERNDLGRVCETGSVAVREFSALRSFPFLHHMVSRVEGHLAPGTSLADLMRAMFPGGSVTGAPKIRAMEIIEELEPCPRGFYTGAIGWTDLHGRSRFNLAIRTAVISAQGLSYHAGGGIVADSDPRREYEETLLKSEAFFRALAELR
jgi:para-aminobenzoate synthetase component 1